MAEEPLGPLEGTTAREDDPGAVRRSTQDEEDPVATGTLFIMLLFLMALAALWVIMYLTLLDR